MKRMAFLTSSAGDTDLVLETVRWMIKNGHSTQGVYIAPLTQASAERIAKSGLLRSFLVEQCWGVFTQEANMKQLQ